MTNEEATLVSYHQLHTFWVNVPLEIVLDQVQRLSLMLPVLCPSRWASRTAY